MLKKNHAILQNYEDQMRDAAEALRKLRLHHEEGKKREDKLRSKLEEAWAEVERK